MLYLAIQFDFRAIDRYKNPCKSSRLLREREQRYVCIYIKPCTIWAKNPYVLTSQTFN